MNNLLWKLTFENYIEYQNNLFLYENINQHENKLLETLILDDVLFLLDEGYLEFSNNYVKNGIPIFEKDDILYLSEGVGRRLLGTAYKGYKAAGKAVHKGRIKLNKGKLAQKVNTTNAGAKVAKTGEYIKGEGKKLVKLPVTTATKLTTHAGTQTVATLAPGSPVTNIVGAKAIERGFKPIQQKTVEKSVTDIASGLTKAGAKRVKDRGVVGTAKDIAVGTTKGTIGTGKLAAKGVKTAYKNRAEIAAKSLDAAKKTAKKSKDVAKYAAKHPVETAAHVAAQSVPQSVLMRPTTAIGVRAASDYVRKGNVAKRLKKDTSSGVSKGVSMVKNLTKQANPDDIPQSVYRVTSKNPNIAKRAARVRYNKEQLKK